MELARRRVLASGDWIEQANAALRHRGPDGTGREVRGSVALGHTRLSIVDVASGDQPLHNEDGSVVLVCNGEIYNHETLREELLARGHRFATRSDSEVILHLYEEDPDTYVSRLKGMFAFFLVDHRSGTVELVRDHLGIKPLFTFLDDDRLLASSEIKALLLHPACSPELDGQAIHDLLTFGYAFGRRTAFRGIRSVAPATRTIWTLATDSCRTVRYWEPSFDHSTAVSAEEFRALFHDVVGEHMSGEHEVGVYLSGGIDSGGIAGSLARHAPYAVSSFTLTFPDPAFDESRFADLITTAHGMRSTRVPAEDPEFSELARAIYHLEQPQIVTLDTANLRLARAARSSGLKPIMAGDGADELLGGYDHFGLDRVRRLVEDKGDVLSGRSAIEQAMAHLRYPPDYLDRYLAVVDADGPRVKDRWGFFPPWYPIWRLNDEIKRPLFVDAWDSTLKDGGPVDGLLQESPGWRSLGAEDRDVWFELETRLPNWILARTDRDSMAHSIEVRVPYLDTRIVAAATSLSHEQRGTLQADKVLLRDAFRGLVPEQILKRGKFAFNTPTDWLFRSRHPEVERLLANDSLRAVGLFEPRAVRDLLARVREGIRGPRSIMHSLRAQTLVGVLTTQLLHELFISRTRTVQEVPCAT